MNNVYYYNGLISSADESITYSICNCDLLGKMMCAYDCFVRLKSIYIWKISFLLRWCSPIVRSWIKFNYRFNLLSNESMISLVCCSVVAFRIWSNNLPSLCLCAMLIASLNCFNSINNSTFSCTLDTPDTYFNASSNFSYFIHSSTKG